MFEALRDVTDDMMLDAVIVHPFLEDREIRIGFFALDSSIGRQDDGQGEAGQSGEEVRDKALMC